MILELQEFPITSYDMIDFPVYIVPYWNVLMKFTISIYPQL